MHLSNITSELLCSFILRSMPHGIAVIEALLHGATTLEMFVEDSLTLPVIVIPMKAMLDHSG